MISICVINEVLFNPWYYDSYHRNPSNYLLNEVSKNQISAVINEKVYSIDIKRVVE